jgi:hypothetical protein
MSLTKRTIQHNALVVERPTSCFASIRIEHGERRGDRKIVLVNAALQCESDGVSL